MVSEGKSFIIPSVGGGLDNILNSVSNIASIPQQWLLAQERLKRMPPAPKPAKPKPARPA